MISYLLTTSDNKTMQMNLIDLNANLQTEITKLENSLNITIVAHSLIED